MTHTHVRTQPWSFMRAGALALLASLIPLGTAYAQTGPRVRVTSEEAEVRWFQHAKGDVLMMAPRGTLLDVVHTEGNKYRHLDSNWYWVIVPPDGWGTRRAGWVSGRDIEEVPPTPRAEPAPVAVVEMPAEPGKAAQPEPVPPTPTSVPEAAQPEMSEVILNFEFGKSNLTDAAKEKLASAMTQIKTQGVAFALEGHADSIGSEAFNERLGLARAETVKRYLAEQYEISQEKISVVSYGEAKPMASNATKEGRAQNRRVVVKVESVAR